MNRSIQALRKYADNSKLIAPKELIVVEHDFVEKESNRANLIKINGISLMNLVINSTISSGYGRCRSCECKGYISKHNGSHECKNCNHHFDRHN